MDGKPIIVLSGCLHIINYKGGATAAFSSGTPMKIKKAQNPEKTTTK